MNKKIICVGGANIDRKFKALTNTIKQGTSNPVSSTTSFGGVARNVAENLAHWTQNISLQCIVGNDSEGQRLLTHLRTLGVNVDHSLIREEGNTSHYYAILNPDGELQVAYVDMEIYNLLSLDSFNSSYDDWDDGSIIFLDTNLPAAIIETIIQHNKNKQLMIFIDPVSVSKANRIPHNLEQVFLIKPNQFEISALTDITISNTKDCIQAGLALLQRGVKNVVISLGRDGYVIVNEKHQQHIPVKIIPHIKDANGAGDAFFAGILFGLQQDLPLIQACELGVAAAALTLQSEKTVSTDITATCLQNTKQEKTHATIF